MDYAYYVIIFICLGFLGVWAFAWFWNVFMPVKIDLLMSWLLLTGLGGLILFFRLILL